MKIYAHIFRIPRKADGEDGNFGDNIGMEIILISISACRHGIFLYSLFHKTALLIAPGIARTVISAVDEYRLSLAFSTMRSIVSCQASFAAYDT